MPLNSLPSINTLLNDEKIRFSLLSEIERCQQLDYCTFFNRRLLLVLENLKRCLVTGKVSTLFAFEFIRLLTKKQLSTYAMYGMKPDSFRAVCEMISEGRVRPSTVFELMYQNVVKLSKSYVDCWRSRMGEAELSSPKWSSGAENLGESCGLNFSKKRIQRKIRGIQKFAKSNGNRNGFTKGIKINRSDSIDFNRSKANSERECNFDFI